MKGIVKFYNDRRRYGFITGEDEKDVFVHATGLKKQGLKTVSIAEGDNVEYEVKESDRGPIAIDVEKIEADAEGEKSEKDDETEKSDKDDETEKSDKDDETEKSAE